MKRATVYVHLQDRHGNPEGLQEIVGYACEIDGISLVVHRSITRDIVADKRVPSATDWTVTEPRTGASVWDGAATWDKPDKPYPRSYAIHRAEVAIAEHGGPAALEAAVEKMQGKA